MEESLVEAVPEEKDWAEQEREREEREERGEREGEREK